MVTPLHRRDFLRTVAGVVSAFPAVLRLQPSWAAGKTVPVGSLLDKTGGINIYGLPAIAATEYAVAEINAKGGLLGKQLELIQYDTQSDIANFPKFAKKLILEDQVVVIHGGITSASRESFRPVIDEYKQLYFYNIIYEGGVCDKYVFVTGETPTQQMGPLAKYALKKYGTKAYTVAADYNFGHISWKWWDIFWRNGGGLEPVAGGKRGQHVGKVEFIPLDVTDFNATINRIQEAKPDVLMSFLVGGAHINFYRQFAAAGLKNKIPIISTTFGFGNEHIVLDAKEVEGLVACYPYYYIGDAGAESYNGWNFWAKAVQKAGSFDREPVTKAMESGIEWDSPMGHVKMDPASHHVIFTMHLASVNGKHGWNVIESFPNIPPTETMQLCDLIKNPNQHTQYQPK
jgi:urea transport system substrate-binding protein